MVLSFHPLFSGDRQILCAGRSPDDKDLRAIRMASAVILPQGCPRSLHRMARENCPHVFPNYDARFQFPGKIGQAHLFQKAGVCFPETETFSSSDDFFKQYPDWEKTSPFNPPFVFKFDWGGEGETVFLISEIPALKKRLQQALRYEAEGQCGFLIQQFIPSGARTLRQVIIGTQIFSYWKIAEHGFLATLSKGAKTEPSWNPEQESLARNQLAGFCAKTSINLAAFDFLFPENGPDGIPYFIEINYFFGRRGLGGSQAYYHLLENAVSTWLETIGQAPV